MWFVQLSEIVDAGGDKSVVNVDGGVERGTHVLKALSLGAKAVGVGRYYLFPLAAAGQAGVERALEQMRHDIERGMRLMGCTSVQELSRPNLRFRKSDRLSTALHHTRRSSVEQPPELKLLMRLPYSVFRLTEITYHILTSYTVSYK